MNKTHLVILDDSKFTRSLLKLPLERVGYEVSDVASPSEALAVLNAKKVHLVISDLRMPDLADGLSFLARLAKWDPRLPVLVYSSETQSAPEIKAQGLLFIDFLSKPAAPERLQEAIASLLGKTQ